MVGLLTTLIPTAHAATLLDGIGEPLDWMTGLSRVFTLANTATTILTTAAGIVAFAMFAYSAFLFFTANGEEAKITKARQVFTYTILGVGLIIVSRFLIVVFVNLLGGSV